MLFLDRVVFMFFGLSYSVFRAAIDCNSYLFFLSKQCADETPLILYFLDHTKFTIIELNVILMKMKGYFTF